LVLELICLCRLQIFSTNSFPQKPFLEYVTLLLPKQTNQFPTANLTAGQVVR
jgi:hypothetical protein